MRSQMDSSTIFEVRSSATDRKNGGEDAERSLAQPRIENLNSLSKRCFFSAFQSECQDASGQTGCSWQITYFTLSWTPWCYKNQVDSLDVFML